MILCLNNAINTVELLKDLGFKIHPEKSALIPGHQITFLDFIIDFVTMKINQWNMENNNFWLLLELIGKYQHYNKRTG